MAPENDFGFRAAALLDPEQSRDASIDLKKSIPVAAGLGGGSSDEAAVLRALDRMWNLGSSRQRLTKLAAELGSDVAFFLSGGTALAEGRGEYVTPLPDAPDAWLVLLVPPMKLAEKTKRMYEAITAKDFSDGSRTESLSRALREGKQVGKAGLYNAFERRAYGFFDGLAGYRDALLSAGASLVHLAGAGPTLFALADGEASAREIANRVRAPDARVFVARTMGAEEATAVTD
jgi:4-diphosphocytidyl-2-C-methyl-D-erythritol kinase